MNDVIVAPDVNPAREIARAGDAAGACKAIVSSTAMNIQGRKYVKVEGWQAIAIAHGCVASSRDVERTETGFRAIGEVRRMDTGAVIATAEGFVGDDESMWAKRAEYARRAMAQTRAISRACRSCFAHVVVMMNAGLETTPAEEIPSDEERIERKPRQQAAARTERPVERQDGGKPAGAPPPITDDNLRARRLAVFKRVGVAAPTDPGAALKALTALHGHACAKLSDMDENDCATIEALSDEQLAATILDAQHDPGEPPDDAREE